MDGATLQALALDALGPYDPPGAAEVLARGTVTVEPDAHGWTASAGTVHGHRVRLAADARTLGMLRAAPAVTDAVCAALAHALGTRAGETLGALTLAWSGEIHGRDEPYRGGHPGSGREALAESLAEYLDAAGEPEAGTVLRTAVVTLTDATLAVTAARTTWHTRNVTHDAARALLGPEVELTWRVQR